MATQTIAPPRVEPQSQTTRRFYVGVSLLMTAIVVSGFWTPYYGPLLRGMANFPWLFHVHGVVFMGWMALLIVQGALVSMRRTPVHRKVGRYGIAYGYLVLAVGLVMTFAAPLYHVSADGWDIDRAASALTLPLGDMILFAGFFTAAVVYRRRPEIHKRLIVVSTVVLLFAADARLIPTRPLPLLLLWLSPLFVAMEYDLWSRGRIHQTYLAALPLLVLGFSRVFLMHWEPWLSIGRSMLTALMS